MYYTGQGTWHSTKAKGGAQGRMYVAQRRLQARKHDIGKGTGNGT